MALIARLKAAGHSNRDIAKMLSTPARTIGPTTIDKWVNRVKTTNEHIAQALASHRHAAVDAWSRALQRGAAFGKHQPARDLLIATGAIAAHDHSDRITIIVGDGTVAIGRLPPALPVSLPTIDITPTDPDA